MLVEDVKHTDPTLFCYSNSLKLQLSKQALEENEWIESLVCDSSSDSSLPALYVSADSKIKRDEWYQKITALTSKKPKNNSKPSKEFSKVGHPQLPPRK